MTNKFWLVHRRVINNPYRNIPDYMRFDSSFAAYVYLLSIIDHASEEQKVRAYKRCFILGNNTCEFDVWYIIPGNDDSFIDNVDIRPFFLGWRGDII
jgi:hypothetical protein